MMKLAANILAFDFERKPIINTEWAKDADTNKMLGLSN